MYFMILIFVLLIFTIISCKLYRGLPRIVLNIFNFMWLGGLAFSNLGFYEMYKPSVFTNNIFLLSVAIFNIIYIIAFNKKNKTNKYITAVNIKYIKLEWLLRINFVVLCICLPYFMVAIRIAKMHGISYLRHLVYVQSPEYISSTYISLLFLWIIQPFLQFVLLITASQIENIWYQKKLWIFAIVDLIFEIVIFGGGRRTIITFVLEIIIFYLLNKKYKKDKLIIQVKNLKIIMILIVIAVVIVQVTASRLTRISVLESMYQYYVGPFIFFDKVIQGGLENTVAQQLGYGRYTFLFIFTPISIIKFVLGLDNGLNEGAIINTNLNNGIFIGKHSIHNAHATSLIYFYSDFGENFFIIGIIVFTLILAYFTKKNQKGYRNFIIAIYFANLAFYSAQTYPFTGIIQYVMIFYVYIFVYKNRSIKNENKKNNKKISIYKIH